MGNKLGRSSESKFTKSTGLYPTCEWDDKAVKKLINKKKIAPRYPGREDGGPEMEECPICFLWYPGGLNRSKCCRQPICTECFLQFKKPSAQKAVQCPFCNAYNYSVKYYGTLSKEEREKMEEEEQKVIAAQIRMKKEELQRQEEREKELAEERKKRAEEGPPPPAARAPTNSSSAVSPPSVPPPEPGRRMPSSSTPRARAPGRPGDHAAHAHAGRHQHQHPPSEEEVDDNFQVDVEELMVMEAIRLSLLDSHAQGRREGRGQGAAEEAGAAGSDSEEEEEEDDDDGLDGGGGEGSEEEDWPAVVWGDQQQQQQQQLQQHHTHTQAHAHLPSARDHAAQPPHSHRFAAGPAAGAASRSARSAMEEELRRVEEWAAREEEEGGGVGEMLRYNRAWFHALITPHLPPQTTTTHHHMHQSPGFVPRPAAAATSPLAGGSSPAALETASTLSPMVVPSPGPAHCHGPPPPSPLPVAEPGATTSPSAGGDDGGERRGNVWEGLQREHQVTPTRYQRAQRAAGQAQAPPPHDSSDPGRATGSPAATTAGAVSPLPTAARDAPAVSPPTPAAAGATAAAAAPPLALVSEPAPPSPAPSAASAAPAPPLAGNSLPLAGNLQLPAGSSPSPAGNSPPPAGNSPLPAGNSPPPAGNSPPPAGNVPPPQAPAASPAAVLPAAAAASSDDTAGAGRADVSAICATPAPAAASAKASVSGGAEGAVEGVTANGVGSEEVAAIDECGVVVVGSSARARAAFLALVAKRQPSSAAEGLHLVSDTGRRFRVLDGGEGAGDASPPAAGSARGLVLVIDCADGGDLARGRVLLDALVSASVARRAGDGTAAGGAELSAVVVVGDVSGGAGRATDGSGWGAVGEKVTEEGLRASLALPPPQPAVPPTAAEVGVFVGCGLSGDGWGAALDSLAARLA